MNKEKYVMAGSSVLLVLMLYFSWRVLPDLREIGVQRRGSLAVHRAGSTEDVLKVSELDDIENKDSNLFAHEDWQEPEKEEKEEKEEKKKEAKENLPKYRLPVTYMGTMKVEFPNQPRRALFKDRDSGEHVRLTRGQQYRGVTVIEVRTNRVVLRNEKGKVFIFQQ